MPFEKPGTQLMTRLLIGKKDLVLEGFSSRLKIEEKPPDIRYIYVYT